MIKISVDVIRNAEMFVTKLLHQTPLNDLVSSSCFSPRQVRVNTVPLPVDRIQRPTDAAAWL